MSLFYFFKLHWNWIQIDQLPEVTTISPNGFWHLSLPHSLFLGGVHNIQTLPTSLREKGSFIGCIQKFEINNRPISIISEALGGSNVDNCPHACVARPCGTLEQCIPNLESYECRCSTMNNVQCNKAEEVPVEEIKEAIASHGGGSASTENGVTDYDLDFTTTMEPIEDVMNSNKNKDYYYNDDNESDDDGGGDDDDYEESSGIKPSTTLTTSITTTSTTTTTTIKPTIKDEIVVEEKVKAPIKSPYKELIEDIEAHYTLKGRYMLLDTLDRDSMKKKKPKKKKGYYDKKTYKDSKNNKKEANLFNDQMNYFYKSDDVNQDISSDFIFNTNEHTSDDIDRIVRGKHKEQHTMRYRPEDDTVIDEILIDEMDKIMKDSVDDNDESNTYHIVLPAETDHLQTQQTPLEQKPQRIHTGACFNGHDSYFHYSDAETMRRIISYQIDLNLRFKTHSNNGLILWSGRHSAQEDDDFLSLGIEEG